MKRRFYILVILLGVYLTSCVSEFRPEVIDPRLPDYSEEGLNTAGAYIDGFPWVSRRRLSYFFIFPVGLSGYGDIYVYCDEDSINNLLAFEFGERNVGGAKTPVTVGFYLENSRISKPQDFINLNGTSIVLDGKSNYGQLFLNPNQRTAHDGKDTLNRGTGMLHIRNVRSISDDSLVISGTFGFDVKIDGVRHTVHSGRFDYTLSPTEIQPLR